MSIVGFTDIYLTEPRFITVVGNTVIEPVGGVNPIVASPITLKNLRGQLKIKVVSGDNDYKSILHVDGGLGGDSQFDPQKNFYFVIGSNINCTVSTPSINTIVVTTLVGDAGGRVYQLVFNPFSPGIAPTIQQLGGTAIGNFNVTVSLIKTNIFWE